MTAATARPTSTHVLRENRDFALLWSGQAASSLGSSMTGVALPLLVLGITGSASSAGAVAFTGMLALLLARLPAGVLADRVDRRNAMIVCDLGRGLMVAGIGIACLLDAVSMVQIYAAVAVAGLCTAVDGAAAVGSLARVVPREQMSVAMTRSQLRDQTVGLCGPPVGGVLFGLARAFPFLTDAVSYLVSAVATRLIRTDLSVAPRSHAGMLSEIREAAGWLARQRTLRLLLSWSVVANFAINGVVIGAILVAREGGASASLIGVMNALAAVGGVIGALAASRLVPRLTARQALTATGLAWAALFATMSLTDSPYLLGALLLLTIVVAPTSAVMVNTAVVVDTPDEMRSRVSSVTGLVASCANPLGPLLMGVLLDAIGRSTMLVFGAVVAVGSLLFLVRSAGVFAPAGDAGPADGPQRADGDDGERGGEPCGEADVRADRPAEEQPVHQP
jgi:MFS family permease